MTVNVVRLAAMEEELKRNPPVKVRMTSGLFWGITAAIVVGNAIVAGLVAAAWMLLR